MTAVEVAPASLAETPRGPCTRTRPIVPPLGDVVVSLEWPCPGRRVSVLASPAARGPEGSAADTVKRYHLRGWVLVPCPVDREGLDALLEAQPHKVSVPARRLLVSRAVGAVLWPADVVARTTGAEAGA